MKCPACGIDTNSDSVFCHKCGARLNEAPGDDGSDRAQPGAADTSAPIHRFRDGGEGQPAGEEKTLWEGGYSPKAMAGAWSVSLLVTALLVALASGSGATPSYGGRLW